MVALPEQVLAAKELLFNKNKKMKHLYILLLLLSTSIFSQTKKLDKLLKRNLQKTVPVLTVSEVENSQDFLFFDAREEKEFKTSHLKNAKQVGYDFFDLEEILTEYPDKTKPILVYCSIGIRSEHIGEKLMKAGYTDVYNLYGGIFEWKNQSKEVVDENEIPTEKVHTFSKEWSKWLLKGEKVYEK